MNVACFFGCRFDCLWMWMWMWMWMGAWWRGEVGGCRFRFRVAHCASLAAVGLHLIHLDAVKRGVIVWEVLQSGIMFIPFELSIFEKQNLRPIVLLYAAIFIQWDAVKVFLLFCNLLLSPHPTTLLQLPTKINLSIYLHSKPVDGSFLLGLPLVTKPILDLAPCPSLTQLLPSYA